MTDNTDNFGQIKGPLVSEGSSDFLAADVASKSGITNLDAEKCIDISSSLRSTNDYAGNEHAVCEHPTIVKGTVVARGTGEGLVLRLDGRVPRSSLYSSLVEYVESRKSFFSGQEVTLEWLESRPAEGVLSEISALLQTRYQMIVKASRMFERNSKSFNNDSENSQTLEKPDTAGMTKDIRTNLRPVAVAVNFDPNQLNSKTGQYKTTPDAGFSNKAIEPQFGGSSDWPLESTWKQDSNWKPESSSLFDGIEAVNRTEGLTISAAKTIGSKPNANSNLFQRKVDMQGFNAPDSKGAVSEALLWDEPDARIIRETLRGGQKIESEHSVIIKGDVNSGAEIVAGGDIFVLGRLRGVAHAGAYDESGAGRMIFALQMQPTQLRIGSIISQGSDENGRVPEIAKIEGNMIVVEPYGISSSHSGSKKTAR